ncbi:unnamed protein product [Ceutorhynchus assimilis]|uniref:Carboxylic ester hydrolase n=1 Tax=Ceutorhynchus assimilis TaxID=467358 RepID=A0A9N9MQT0_9CUCU|nr:unnamed protein product [Ceutorhynchus assimilis]
MKKKQLKPTIFFVLFIILVIILLACALLYTRNSTDNNLLVSLPNGQVRGAIYVTKTGKTYYGFRGIPYAKPPVGDLRYELPQSVEPWNGILNASIDGKACISLEYSASAQSEDCLFINIYVPSIGKLLENKHLPVMFWIHGGGLTTNSSDKLWNGPDFLVEKNVIMVSINYRLGPLSFLSTGDSILPGNLGLKDQAFAMVWVRDNIEHFGGDPDKVTIFGHSAGAISVGAHLLSKRSAGLFRAAILQSGSVTQYRAIERNPRSVAFALANKIPGGFYQNDTRVLKDFLKSKSVEDILNATLLLPSSMSFWLTMEPESDDAFLTESPYVLLESGNFNQVPIIIGVTAEESAYFLKDLNGTKSTAEALESSPSNIIPSDLYTNSTSEPAILQKIREIYLNEGETFSSNLTAFVKFYSDDLFKIAAQKHAEHASKYVPVYQYQFSYFGRFGSTIPIDGIEKATHTSDLPFILNLFGSDGDTDVTNLLVQEQIVTLWTNFAKYLNPTPFETKLFDNIIWSTFNNPDFPYLSINSSLEVQTNLGGRAYSSWYDIYGTYGRKLFKLGVE